MSAILDMSDPQTRSRVEALARSCESRIAPHDVDLANCCDFLLGVPTFVAMTGYYAHATVTRALEAGGGPSAKRPPDEHRAADPATGPIGEGESTGEEE